MDKQRLLHNGFGTAPAAGSLLDAVRRALAREKQLSFL
jgi:hypothetical protein